MTDTHIQHLPNALDAITMSVSLTGLTILKTSTYKCRHSGMSDFRDLPGQGVVKKSIFDDAIKQSLTVKSPRKKVINEPITPKPPKQRTKAYKVHRKQVTHRIRNFVNQMPGEKKLFFWTVTFPEGTSDDTAHILLNRWLTRLRKENMLKSYLWVSERQKNNTIHFHIALHQRICVKKANRYMRACIFTAIEKKEMNYSRMEAIKYNGVDIAKDRKTRRVTNFAKGKHAKNLTNYLTKYVTKNDQTFTHLAWHSSRDYSNLCIALHITDREYSRSNIKNLISTEAPFENEWIVFYKWIKSPPGDLLEYLKMINQHLLNQVVI